MRLRQQEASGQRQEVRSATARRIRNGLWGRAWAVVALLGCVACPGSPTADPGNDDMPAGSLDMAAAEDLGPSRTELFNSDVTIVYPLPPASDLNLMVWGNTLSNSYGRFVPQSAFAQIPLPLDPRPGSKTRTTGTTAWNELRLVGVRLDPCFGSRGEVPDAQCKNQVRLVFQGIHGVNNTSAGEDGAIHMLYELPRAELLTLTREIISLTDREGSYTPGPLGVHPILARQGVWGPFAQGLKVLLRRYVGEDRAVRMTFFARVDALQSAWRFGGFDHKVTGWERIQIPTTSTTEQELLGGFPNAGELAGTTTTPGSSGDDLRLLINSSAANLANATARQTAFGAALRIEHPAKHTPDTVDCLSCHVAMAARSLGETQYGLSAIGHPDRYTSTRDLRFVPPAEPSLENLHALSYLGTELGINLRTVNETAEIATALSTLLGAQK